MRSLLLLPVILALLGCGGGSSYAKEKVNLCDTSLTRCVQVLGDEHKEKCYETYNSCMTKK